MQEKTRQDKKLIHIYVAETSIQAETQISLFIMQSQHQRHLPYERKHLVLSCCPFFLLGSSLTILYSPVQIYAPRYNRIESLKNPSCERLHDHPKLHSRDRDIHHLVFKWAVCKTNLQTRYTSYQIVESVVSTRSASCFTLSEWATLSTVVS